MRSGSGTSFTSVRNGLAAALALTLALGAAPARAQSADHPQNEKLKVAADVGYAPWAMRKPTGELEGFSIDIANEIAKRLGRPGAEIVDVNFSAIFAGLFAKRYELIIAPTSMTKERAEQMLFTEGYMTGGLAFVTAAATPDMSGPEDLKGKALATNNGSLSDTWATQNAEKYGFTVQRYDKDTDAMQAVVSGRAFANISDVYVSRYAASRNKAIKVGYVLFSDRRLGFPMRKDDVAFRNKVEDAIECMKLDGSLAQIHTKWFAAPPGEDTASMQVFVGYGPVGLPGFSADYHVPACK